MYLYENLQGHIAPNIKELFNFKILIAIAIFVIENRLDPFQTRKEFGKMHSTIMEQNIRIGWNNIVIVVMKSDISLYRPNKNGQ